MILLKIALLIGNGFDLNLGLKTSYLDFKKYLESNGMIDNLNLYRFLNENKNDDLELWSDLEKSLGGLLSENSWQGLEVSKSEISDFVSSEIEQVLTDLKVYLSIEERKIDFNKSIDVVVRDIQNTFLNIIKPTEVKDQNKLRNVFAFDKGTIEIYPIVFNYTSVFDKMISHLPSFTNRSYNYRIYDSNHPHGTLDDGMILGVNDVDQIKNFEHCVLESDDLVYVLKVKAPEISSNLEYNQAIDIVNDADLIIVFGMSIGDTDKFWWQCIQNRMLSLDSVYLIVFTRGSEDCPPDRSNRRKYFKAQKKIKKLICEDGDTLGKIGERIIVEFDRELFSEIKEKFEDSIHPEKKDSTA